MIQLLPNRSRNAIEHKVSRLRRLGKYSNLLKKKVVWKEHDIKILNERKDASKEELMKLLAGRTWTAIRKKRREIGLARPPSRPWSKEEDIKAKNLIENRYNFKEAARILGRTYRSIALRNSLKWKYNIKSPYKPDFSPSPSLLYILGVLKGDGSTPYNKNVNYVTKLGVRDKEFALAFCKALHTVGLYNARVHRYLRDGKAHYECWAGCKEFAEWCNAKPLSIIKKMSRNNDKLAFAFLKGFYESEGNLTQEKKHGTISITMTNTNKELIDFIEELIKKLGYSPSKYIAREGRITEDGSKWKTLYVIYILGSGEEKIDFLTKLKPSIPRKSIKAIDKSRVV